VPGRATTMILSAVVSARVPRGARCGPFERAVHWPTSHAVALKLGRVGSLVTYRQTRRRLFRLATLGSVDLRAPDDGPLDGLLAQPKRVALLVYLAAARSVFHRRDRLVALFWPELDEARARDALSQALRFLRKSLGPDALLTRGVDEVGVDRDHVWCDAVEFRAALDHDRPEDALRLYRGDFLDGFFVEEASGFEEWVESERAALREAAARGARLLAERHDGAGQHTVAVGWGKRAVELAPDDERAFRRLLKLLERAGDRAGALQAYDEFARRLRADYGAEPAVETIALVEAMRREGGERQSPPVVSPIDHPLRVSPVPDRAVRDHVSVSQSPLGVGESLANGRYVIERELGTGGMATVYLALDVRHDRRVAVKVLRPDVAASIGARALLREIRIAASLQHPHVVPLFDSGESDGLVFFVMPHVDGQSLRVLLQREPRLPLDMVIGILRDVASALAHAHQRGIIHRDIKPDNILLSGEPGTKEFHALVADFGVAKAVGVTRAAGTADATNTLSGFGGAVGTPAYMAPEQAAGRHVDGRADVFGWGVVAYEMLAGAHPRASGAFMSSGGSPAGAARDLQLRRRDAPAWLVSLVIRCLDTSALGRPMAAEVDTAMQRGGFSGRSTLERPSRSWLARLPFAVGFVLALGVVSWVAWRAWIGRGVLAAEIASDSSSLPLDTTRYAILPFAYDSGTGTLRDESQRLHDAFSKWGGVALVDEFQLGEAVSRRSQSNLTAREAQDISRVLGAGYYVRGDVQHVGSTIRMHVVLYATRTNAPIRDTTVRLAKDASLGDSVFDQVADHLLLGTTRRSEQVGARWTTRSLPARRAFLGAQTALERWDLASADSQFFAATRFDSSYAQAWLWLAQVRWWQRAPSVAWKDAAARSALAGHRLSPREGKLAAALVAAAAGDLVRTCRALVDLTREDQFDFAAWYGASECLARDETVIRDPASPSGWRFRTSYHQSITAYRRAVRLFPSIHRALRDGAFASVRLRLKTSGNFTRQGHALDAGQGRFLAYPGWQGDSLVFVPFPESQFLSAEPSTIPLTRAQAVRKQRELFHEIASAWVAALPDSPDAQEALAISRQLLNDPTAIEIIQRARRLAVDRNDRVRLASLEVATRLRFGLPSDITQLREARRLADSVIRDTPEDSIDDVRSLIGLAALTGRATLAARLSRHRSVQVAWGVPARLSDVAAALWVFAAFGGPADSLTALESRFERTLRTRLTPDSAAIAVNTWLVRASVLAFPEYRFAVLAAPVPQNDYYLRTAVAALIAGDTSAARRVLRSVEQARRRSQPADRAIDALYTEARILESLGDRDAAAEWLDPTLDAIANADPLVVADPTRAAPLMRAMALRADLAIALGDVVTARQWATPVAVFWSDADEFLRPLVARMTQLAGRIHPADR